MVVFLEQTGWWRYVHDAIDELKIVETPTMNRRVRGRRITCLRTASQVDDCQYRVAIFVRHRPELIEIRTGWQSIHVPRNRVRRFLVALEIVADYRICKPRNRAILDVSGILIADVHGRAQQDDGIRVHCGRRCVNKDGKPVAGRGSCICHDSWIWLGGVLFLGQREVIFIRSSSLSKAHKTRDTAIAGTEFVLSTRIGNTLAQVDYGGRAIAIASTQSLRQSVS